MAMDWGTGLFERIITAVDFRILTVIAWSLLAIAKFSRNFDGYWRKSGFNLTWLNHFFRCSLRWM
jgi:hypothetical protein